MKQALAKVTNPEGRVDVLLYQCAGRLMERLERERGLMGIQQHFLPIVEDFILANVSSRNVIPRELAAALKVFQANRRR